MISKNDDGFTLTEALVGLLLISLSLGGLFQVGSLVSRQYNKTVEIQHRAQNFKRLVANLETDLRPLEPITNGVIGDKNTIRNDSLLIQGSKSGAQFSYLSEGQVFNHWPVERVIDDLPHTPMRLEAIVITDKQGMPLGLVAFKVENAKDCVFDMITRNCRPEAA
jgi:type II secretory pathway pseudopilin PulG